MNLFQQAAQIDIGREENLRHPVKTGASQQRGIFNFLFRGRSFAARKHAQKPPERCAAYSCRLVCHEATSGIFRFLASHAPRMPGSLGPVMCTISGRNARRRSSRNFLCRRNAGSKVRSFSKRKEIGAAAGNIERRQFPQLLLAYRAVFSCPDADKKKADLFVAQRLQSAGWCGPPR